MAWDLLNFFAPLNQQGTNAQTGAMGVQTPSTPWTGIDGAAQFVAPQRLLLVNSKFLNRKTFMMPTLNMALSHCVGNKLFKTSLDKLILFKTQV